MAVPDFDVFLKKMCPINGSLPGVFLCNNQLRCQNRFAVLWGRWWLRWGGNETDMI